MKKRMVYDIIVGLSYYLLPLLVYGAVSLTAADSPAHVAYGMIAAWWAALYISGFLGLSIRHVWHLVIFGIPFSAYLASRRHDVGYSIPGNIVLLFVLLSPFLANMILAALKKWLSPSPSMQVPGE